MTARMTRAMSSPRRPVCAISRDVMLLKRYLYFFVNSTNFSAPALFIKFLDVSKDFNRLGFKVGAPWPKWVPRKYSATVSNTVGPRLLLLRSERTSKDCWPMLCAKLNSIGPDSNMAFMYNSRNCVISRTALPRRAIPSSFLIALPLISNLMSWRISLIFSDNSVSSSPDLIRISTFFRKNSLSFLAMGGGGSIAINDLRPRWLKLTSKTSRCRRASTKFWSSVMEAFSSRVMETFISLKTGISVTNPVSTRIPVEQSLFSAMESDFSDGSLAMVLKRGPACAKSVAVGGQASKSLPATFKDTSLPSLVIVGANRANLSSPNLLSLKSNSSISSGDKRSMANFKAAVKPVKSFSNFALL
mmetsp:Transcript_50878/g.108038  ORF Transcript_50878/g.108038 Transcript_50878/m.108038 type:complete len:359 (+) Transcript_50878:601-1677(+)